MSTKSGHMALLCLPLPIHFWLPSTAQGGDEKADKPLITAVQNALPKNSSGRSAAITAVHNSIVLLITRGINSSFLRLNNFEICTCTHRKRQQEGKHSQHCDGAGRDFLAIPGTTLGSTGHRPFLDIIDAAWSRAIRHNLDGSEGRSIQEEKQAYYARLHAVLLRYTAYHIKALSNNT